MDAPLSANSLLRGIYSQPVEHIKSQSSEAYEPEGAVHSNFAAVCKNWAREIAEKNKVSIDEAISSIVKLLNENTPDAEKKSALIHALDRVNWANDPIFNNIDEMAWYALACLKDEKISVEQFSTLMSYRTGVIHHSKYGPLTPISLFITNAKGEQTVNPVARTIIEKTFEPQVVQVALIKGTRLQEKSQLDKAQIDDFFERMKDAPLSEQQFFVMSPKDSLVSKIKTHVQPGQKEKGIVEAIYDTGFNAFNYFSEVHEGKQILKRMVASTTMMQTFIDVKYENPVKLNPVIGLSSISDIENNAIQRTREFGLNFVKNSLPTIADRRKAVGVDFPYHDFFHACVASSIPEEHVGIILELYNIVKEIRSNQQLKSIDDFLNEFEIQLIDMEGGEYEAQYTQLNRQDLGAIFWNFLHSKYEAALAEYKFDKNLNTTEQFVEFTFSIYEAGFFDVLAEQILSVLDFFEEKGVSSSYLCELGDLHKQLVEQTCEEEWNKKPEMHSAPNAQARKQRIHDAVVSHHEKTNFPIALDDAMHRLSDVSENDSN